MTSDLPMIRIHKNIFWYTEHIEVYMQKDQNPKPKQFSKFIKIRIVVELNSNKRTLKID